MAARGLQEAAPEEREKAYKEAQEAKKAGKPKPKRKGFFSYYFKAVSEPADSPTKVTERQVKEIFAFVAPRVVGKKWEETKALKSRSLTRG